MKLWVLIENSASSPAFSCEHGLSLRIETNGRTLLFDMGQSSLFLRNAAALGLSPADIEAAVVSHGHYDHGGGLPAFLETNRTAPVFLADTAFEGHVNTVRKADIGLPPALKQSPRLRLIAEDTEILPGIRAVFPPAPPKFPVRPFGLAREADGRQEPEDFRHELYLLAEDAGRRILFSGCAHRGILNLMDWFRPDIYVGGFHLKPLNPDLPDDRRTIEDVGRRLAAYPCRYLTGHCTGDRQYNLLKPLLGNRLERLASGRCFTL